MKIQDITKMKKNRSLLAISLAILLATSMLSSILARQARETDKPKVTYLESYLAPYLLGSSYAPDCTVIPELEYVFGTNPNTVPLDGTIVNYPLAEVFAERMLYPDTDHPDGMAYTWVYDDENNVYFVLDLTDDNTFDNGEDYFKVHIDDGSGIRTYAQYTEPVGGDYGVAIFGYTDKVEDQHMYYVIAVPKSELQSDSIKVGFEMYGTLADINFTIRIYKHLSGVNIPTETFNFTLTQVDPDNSPFSGGHPVIRTGQIVGDGSMSFKAIKPEENENTLYFKITENNDGADGWVYDTTERFIRVDINPYGLNAEVVDLSPSGYTFDNFNNEYQGNYVTFENIYDDEPKPIDVTITKTVTGQYSNVNHNFDFTVYFQDKSEKALPIATILEYEKTGDGISTPEIGDLILDGEGKATFSLKNGQNLVIKDVLENGYIKVVETKLLNYETTFKDNEKTYSESGRDTDYQKIMVSREFDFVNNRDEIVITGLTSDNLQAFSVVLAISAVLLGMVWVMLEINMKKEYGKNNRKPA